MKIKKNTRWIAIAIGFLSGQALAAPINCTVEPRNSIVTEGQTLQLTARCNGPIQSINWNMSASNDVSVSGDVYVYNYQPGEPLLFTTPVALPSFGWGNELFFFVNAVPASSADYFDPMGWPFAVVVVKPSSAVLAVASGLQAPMIPSNAQCGFAHGVSTAVMPTGSAQCAPGSKAALAISGPQSFSWSCLSLTGGAEASCYALRGYKVSAVAGANGTVSPVAQSVASGGTAIFTAAPSANYAAVMSGCGGTQSGNKFTTGPVTKDCTVTATFNNLPINGACGAASNVATGSPPSALCSVSKTTPTVAANVANYTWNCDGFNGGMTASCTAPRTYTVTATAGSNGSISPASRQVVGNTSTTFTVSSGVGYSATVGGTCGGALSGATYTTSAIKGPCTVATSFTAPAVSEPGIGKGLWVPPGMPNRTIADQSSSEMLVSYVPGCLNGAFAKDSSSACAANTSFQGTLAGTATPHTVTFGSGKQLVLRYKTRATVTNGKQVIVAGWNAGNVNVNMRIWLSNDPMATYASASTYCKAASTTSPRIATGTETSVTTSTTVFGKITTTTKNYCKLLPNTTYYFGMEYDDNKADRFQVFESGSDFL